MAIDGIAKNQHYVPQFILKNFSNGNKDQVYVFDKAGDKTFRSNVRNVASENGFYNFQVDDEEHSLEPLLCDIEAKSALIINRIIESESLSHLTKEDKSILSHFMAIQFVRTKDYREHYKDGAIKLLEALKVRGFTDDVLEYHEFNIPSDDDIKEFGLQAILDAPRIAPFFYKKDWTIQKAPNEAKLYISDHPISMNNFYPATGIRSNLGLAVEGIQLNFPISPKLSIGMHCPTLLEKFKREILNAKANLLLSPTANLNIEPIKVMDKLISSFETGSPIALTKDNVTHLNSLQVMNGNRFVYSSNAEFKLIKDMLKKNSVYRTGQRSIVQ
ncbi:DUF4238 domain-containing protein [Vibrio campbellii]|uniref:DUF4238 domain-containing protein n=1 Tax=Vibrio campbellii TaxID=680 RepID=UPI003857B9A9